MASNMGAWALVASVCTYLTKRLSLHWQLPRKLSCCVPILPSMMFLLNMLLLSRPVSLLLCSNYPLLCANGPPMHFTFSLILITSKYDVHAVLLLCFCRAHEVLMRCFDGGPPLLQRRSSSSLVVLLLSLKFSYSAPTLLLLSSFGVSVCWFLHIYVFPPLFPSSDGFNPLHPAMFFYF